MVYLLSMQSQCVRKTYRNVPWNVVVQATVNSGAPLACTETGVPTLRSHVAAPQTVSSRSIDWPFQRNMADDQLPVVLPADWRLLQPLRAVFHRPDPGRADRPGFPGVVGTPR